MKILVIDDNQDFRELLGELIGSYSADADVVLAENGVKGLRIFSSNPVSFDIVFTDRQMPGMLGEEVVREIKKNFTADKGCFCKWGLSRRSSSGGKSRRSG